MHYLDNAATTRVADTVADTADAVLRAHYANPSSLYAPGAQSEFVLSGAVFVQFPSASSFQLPPEHQWPQ